MFYAPLILLFMLGFFGLLVLLFLLIMVGAVSYAFDKIGLHPAVVFVLFLACLIGGYINIPVRRMRNDRVITDRAVVSFFGLRFRVPVRVRPETVVAVNLNLKDLTALRAPVVSIGGAGTIDGIFLTGIIAVLLA